jgi:hypothetical protein
MELLFMTEENTNVANPHLRGLFLHIVKMEWITFRESIKNQIIMLKPHLKEISQKKLEESFTTLESVVSNIVPDPNYQTNENHIVFETSIMGLESSLKDLFEAFIADASLYGKLKNTGRRNVDSIDNLAFFVHSEMAFKRSSNPVESDSFYGYPSITRIIKFIRNKKVVHSFEEPSAYQLRMESYDNIFTLCSILILTFYGYSEILDTWYLTIQATKTPKQH